MNIPRVTSFRASDMMTEPDVVRDRAWRDCYNLMTYGQVRSLPVMVSPQPQVWLVDHPTSLDEDASRFPLLTEKATSSNPSDSFIKTP